jgi:hypothetical protein
MFWGVSTVMQRQYSRGSRNNQMLQIGTILLTVGIAFWVAKLLIIYLGWLIPIAIISGVVLMILGSILPKR